MIYVAIMIPGIVIGIATLIALVTLFKFLNPLLEMLWFSSTEKPPRLNLGYGSLIAAHTLFKADVDGENHQWQIAVDNPDQNRKGRIDQTHILDPDEVEKKGNTAPTEDENPSISPDQ